jgi:hypothetical protein
MNDPKCKACGSGALVKKRVDRLSGVAVALGYLLLAPSLLGLLVAIALFLVSGVASTKDLSQKLKKDVSVDLKKAGASQNLIVKVIGFQKVSEDDEKDLTEQQKGAVRSGRVRMANGPLPESAIWLTAIVVRVGSLYVGAFSLLGAVLGWLLVRKKEVLACDQCDDASPASRTQIPHRESGGAANAPERRRKRKEWHRETARTVGLGGRLAARRR